jgi:hypothetical protein
MSRHTNGSDELEVTETPDTEQEPLVSGTVGQIAKRMSRKSTELQKRWCLAQIDAELAAKKTSPTKIRALQSKLESLDKTLDREFEAKKNAALIENETLKSRHEADAAEIATLQQQVSTLESKAVEVKTVTVTIPDPEAAQLREQNSGFITLLKTVAESLDDIERPQMAIRVIQTCPPATAKVFVQMLGLNYESYAQMLGTYKSERELLDVIERATVEGPAVIFAKAALAVRDARAAKGAINRPEQQFVPDNRSAEEKIKAAKELVRQCAYDVRVQEELNRPRGHGIAGIDDARMKENPRVVYQQPERPAAISGGADRSEWV